MKSEHLNEIKGLVIFAFALILLASFISYTPEDLSWFTAHPNFPPKNFIRLAGAYTAGSLFFIFGYSAYLFVLFLFFWSWNIFISRVMMFTFARMMSLVFLVTVMSGVLSLLGGDIISDQFSLGGFVGVFGSKFLVENLGLLGAYIVFGTIACLCLVISGDFLVSPIIINVTRWFISLSKQLKQKNVWLSMREMFFKQQESLKTSKKKSSRKDFDEEDDEDDEEEMDEDVDIKRIGKEERTSSKKEILSQKDSKPVLKNEVRQAPNIRIIKPQEAPAKEREDKPLVVGAYQLPSFDLLDDPPKIAEANLQEALVSGSKTLEQTLESFGVKARVVDIERGPVITRYELQPEPGVRVQSINALSDDIALAMQASSIRIQAPIPGKNRVGIEVPNGAKAAVVLKDVLIQGNIRQSKSKLTLALGKDTAGKPMIANLADMPHLLVAGSTGSGKTVALNVIITSILYNAAPNEVKFIMIDPKMVELIQYNDIPHMLCPAITDPKKVMAALGWVVSEMETRYKLLAKNQVRNIGAYHAKGFEMPYIVVVVDEFADLMQTSGKMVEGAITRLAQLARAVGIHLILATQRPSVNVITGTIKANLPARIAFRVNSQVDSRTILDEKGAEDLLGKGDMLFMKPGDAKPTRGQCSFLSDDEIHRVMDFIRAQEKPKYDETVTAKPAVVAGNQDDKDEMYDEVLRFIMESGKASIAMLQRRFSIGFSRAGRLIDQLERSGIIGPDTGSSKPREILVDRDKWLVDNITQQQTETTSEEKNNE